MMNGYAMSGWGWLLMTVGMLGFWALVAVSPSPCCGAPANPTSSHSPASPISSHGPAPRTSWPSGWPAASSTPTSTASASRPSRRPPTGHDPRHLQSPSPIPRVGSAAQPGQQLRPVSQLLLHHGAEHRLVDVPVHLIPVDAPERWVRVILDRYLDHPGSRLVGEAGDQRQGHVDAGRHPGRGDELAVPPPTAAAGRWRPGAPAAGDRPSGWWPGDPPAARPRPGPAPRCRPTRLPARCRQPGAGSRG
jgi:hypothetical protein